MKSRIITAPQIILSYGLNDLQIKKLDDITSKTDVKHKIVGACDAGQKIGFLCGLKGFERIESSEGAASDEQCLVFSGIQRKSIDSLLKELRDKEISVPLKAMVTPSNRSWSLTQLIAELKREHETLTGRKN